MASSAVAQGVKAIYAQPAFIPKGPINAGRFNLIREIFTGFGLGLVGGFVWKTYHWGEKRRIAEYYKQLDQREREEEEKYNNELLAKLKELEEEL